MANLARGALALLAACAPIHTRETALDTALASTFQRETLADSVAYTVVPAVQREVLVLAISEAERCVEIETPRRHRTTHVERHPDVRIMSGLWVVGVLFTVGGALGYIDADNVAASQTQSGMATTPTEVRNSGIVGMAIGGLTLLAVAGNYIRARDGDRDDGVLSDPPVRRQYACHQSPTRETSVTLDLGGATLRGGTDGDGRAAFAMTDVPGDALPQHGRPLGVVIGNRRARFELADNDIAELRRALHADPSSRLATELVELCSGILDRADRLLSGNLSREHAGLVASALSEAESQCTNPAQAARVRILNTRLAARVAAIEDEERRAAEAPQQQQQQQQQPQQETDLLGWACGGRANKLAFGVLTCLAPVAGEICSKSSEEAFKFVVEKFVRRFVPAKLQSATLYAINGLIAKAGADVIGQACQRFVDERQLPQLGSVLTCAWRVGTWIDQHCPGNQ